MCNRRVDCVGPDWTIIRSFSRAVYAKASSAGARCPAPSSVRSPPWQRVVQWLPASARRSTSSRMRSASAAGRPLPRSQRAQLAIDRCVLAEAAAAGHEGSRARGADRLVCGRERIRMSQAVQALGLSAGGVEEMVLAVNAAFSVVRLREAPALRRPGSSHAPRSPAGRSLMSPRGVRPARDGPGFWTMRFAAPVRDRLWRSRRVSSSSR